MMNLFFYLKLVKNYNDELNSKTAVRTLPMAKNCFEFKHFYSSNYSVHTYIDFNEIAMYFKFSKAEKEHLQNLEIELKNFVDYTILTSQVEYSNIITSNNNYSLSEIWGTLITPNNKIFSEATILKKLDLAETKKLLNDLIHIEFVSKGEDSDCSFNPHEAIVFYNKQNQIISVLELCFICGEISFNYLPRKFDLQNPMTHYSPTGTFYSIVSPTKMLSAYQLDSNLKLLLKNAQIRIYKEKINVLK